MKGGWWWIAAAGAIVLVLTYCSLKPEKRTSAPGSRDTAAADPASKGGAGPRDERADATTGNRSGADSGMTSNAPRGFEMGVSFTNLPDDPSVRFDIQRQEIQDDVLRGTYRITSYVRDQRALFVLYTREGEPVSQLRVQFNRGGRPSGDDYPVRLYSILDEPGLTPAGREMRGRLNLERFAQALATLPSLRHLQKPYRIHFQPPGPGEPL